MRSIDRRRDRDDDEIRFGEPGRISGDLQLRCGAKIVGGHLPCGIDEPSIAFDLALGKIESDRMELLAEFNSEGQTDVPKTNHSDRMNFGHLAVRLWILGYAFCRGTRRSRKVVEHGDAPEKGALVATIANVALQSLLGERLRDDAR